MEKSNVNAKTNGKPRLWLIGVGGMTLIIGMAVTLYGLANFMGFILDSSDELQRAKAPGQATVMVENPGRIVIYQEWREAMERGTRRSGKTLRTSMTCVLHDGNGQEIAVVPARSVETYKIGDIEGLSVWEFEAPASGSYTLDIQPSGAFKGEFDLTIGPSMLGSSMKQFVMSIIALIVGGIADALGIVLIFIGILRRSRSKRQQPKELAGEA